MSLPELIEIVPLARPVRAVVTVPGSKSVTNRALVLAALASGTSVLEGALWSEDTQIMVEALTRLGFELDVQPDPDQQSNCIITVHGMGGRIPHGGTESTPLELFVGNAGTAARFLAALVCLGRGVYRLVGTERMHQRPQAGLFSALRQLGYAIEAAPGDRLPATIRSSGPCPTRRHCTVDITESSQFASALLLCAEHGNWSVTITGENKDESPYVAMTTKLVAAFPRYGGRFNIEPDASGGSYFWAAGVIQNPRIADHWPTDALTRLATEPNTVFPVTVRNWPFESGWQVDARFPEYLIRMLAPDRAPFAAARASASEPPLQISRIHDLGDSILTAMVLAPLAPRPTLFTDLGRLRLQECERVAAMRTELTKCGARVLEHGDTLMIEPSPLHGAEIDSYNDHRMAMCFAVLGLKVPGIRIRNPACVRKTFPDFFRKLTAPPPDGLGAVVLDAHQARPLAPDTTSAA